MNKSTVSTVSSATYAHTTVQVKSRSKLDEIFPTYLSLDQSKGLGREDEAGGGPVVLQGRYSLSRMGLRVRETWEIPFGRVVLPQGDRTEPGERPENLSGTRQGPARLRKVQKGVQDRGEMRGARLTFFFFFPKKLEENIENIFSFRIILNCFHRIRFVSRKREIEGELNFLFQFTRISRGIILYIR